MIDTPEPPGGTNIGGIAELGGGPEIPGAIFQGHSQPPIVHQAATGPVHLPSTQRTQGLLVYKTIPVYLQPTYREGGTQRGRSVVR